MAAVTKEGLLVSTRLMASPSNGEFFLAPGGTAAVCLASAVAPAAAASIADVRVRGTGLSSRIDGPT